MFLWQCPYTFYSRHQTLVEILVQFYKNNSKRCDSNWKRTSNTRCLPGGDWSHLSSLIPIRGLIPQNPGRLRWSFIIMTSPTLYLGLIPPAALVRIKVLTPIFHITLTGKTTLSKCKTKGLNLLFKMSMVCAVYHFYETYIKSNGLLSWMWMWAKFVLL